MIVRDYSALRCLVVGLSFAVLSNAAAAEGEKADAAAPVASEPAAGAKSDQGTPAVVIDDNRIESLLGKDVSGPDGAKLGRVVDVLVSRNGEISAAVIDFGGFLGVGTRKVAVAWPTLKFADKGVVLEMTKDELRVTPEYRAGEPVVVVGRAAAKSVQDPSPSPTPE